MILFSECEREDEGGDGVSERESLREGGSEFPREREVVNKKTKKIALPVLQYSVLIPSTVQLCKTFSNLRRPDGRGNFVIFVNSIIYCS